MLSAEVFFLAGFSRNPDLEYDPTDYVRNETRVRVPFLRPTYHNSPEIH